MTSLPYPAGDAGSDSTISSATEIAVPSSASHILIQALTQNVRIRVDGGAATTTSGFRIAAGELLQIPVRRGGTVSIIEETASASAQWQWLTTD